MAIVNCPECKVEVSDKAKSCPKCAYPINSENSVSIIDKKKGMSFTNWITVVFSGLYIVSPLDIIPDVIPVVGWVDDLLLGITGVSTVLNSQLSKGNVTLSLILKSFKYISFAIFTIMGILILLLGSVVYKMFN